MTSDPHAARAWPRPRLLGVYFVVLILLLYLPIAVLLLFSFNCRNQSLASRCRG